VVIGSLRSCKSPLALAGGYPRHGYRADWRQTPVAAAPSGPPRTGIVLSSSMTTSARSLHKGLQPRQDFIDHMIRHVLYEPCEACGMVDGSRLVAHHNALRFGACVH
jgi:hypothetical protein